MTRPACSRLACVLIATALAGGCASTPGPATLDGSLAAYRSGSYADAFEQAAEVMRTADGRAREQAAYVSGISAYRLGQLDEAELRLATAVDSSDPAVAANARATLGLVRLEQDRPGEAAALFRDAATPDEGLASDDRAIAQRYAAACDHATGNDTGYAGGHAGAGETDGAFTLQVGAFANLGRAERAAAEAKSASRGVGLGHPRVIPRRFAGGDRLFVVQVGTFETRNEAVRAHNRIRRPHYIVAETSLQ